MPMNKVILLGNLGQDPELKYLPNGNGVANLSLATSESWTDKNGQKQEKVEWHRIIVFGKMAEVCAQYLSKGSTILVEGKLQTRNWEDKQTQKKMYITEIIANNVQFVGGKPKQSQNNQQQQQQQNNQPPQNFANDDIPF